MRRQTDITPDINSLVHLAMDVLHATLSAAPDLDTLTGAVNDWAKDVARSDASDLDKEQCDALAFSTWAMFRHLEAADAGKTSLMIYGPATLAMLEWDRSKPISPDFEETVDMAVRNALGKRADA